ncbi:hypothetical protein QMK38_01070 [Lysinibacillus fusiformis]|nr:hypothetical protein [Lysinibacillus fusiformis]
MLSIYETENDGFSYGYAIWIKNGGHGLQFILMGYDPGINFLVSYYTKARLANRDLFR